MTSTLRKNNRIKLPDTIIYATAEVMKGKLLTNSTIDFEKINGDVERFNPINL